MEQADNRAEAENGAGPASDDTRVAYRLQRRRLLFWRVLALVACVAAFWMLFLPSHRQGPTDSIARLEIKGIISDRMQATVEAIDRLASDPHTHGLLLVIDSPGGGVTGGVAIHDAIESFAARKPVAVSMQGVAASAGYMIAAPARRIFAYPSTITGSIGVIMIRPDASTLLDRIGVTADTITSGPMKDQSQPFVPLKPEGRAMLQGVVDDLFDQFVAIVAKGRHRPMEEIRKLADGRPYTGRQALPLHLVDQLGDEKQARLWLGAQIRDGKTMPVREVSTQKPPKTVWEFIHRHFGGGWFAMPEALRQFARYHALDGAVAILPR